VERVRRADLFRAIRRFIEEVDGEDGKATGERR
jgi:hypothetical protein